MKTLAVKTFASSRTTNFLTCAIITFTGAQTLTWNTSAGYLLGGIILTMTAIL